METAALTSRTMESDNNVFLLFVPRDRSAFVLHWMDIGETRQMKTCFSFGGGPYGKNNNNIAIYFSLNHEFDF